MLSKRQVNALHKIIGQIEKIISSSEKLPSGRDRKVQKASKSGRKGRRTRSEAVALKKAISAERKHGVPVADLASKYGVTAAYIYMMK